ncbi:MAG: proline iminopeptidase-family hydrolase [Novosphingobium sp.]
MSENFLTMAEGRVWRNVRGEGPPLIIVHGGPGAGHDYLCNLDQLADSHTVVLYDQLGCGRSDQVGDVGHWEVARFVDELDALRDSLGFGRFSLLGHSWGGFVAIEYALAHPERLTALVLASTAASVADVEASHGRLRDALPSDIREPMRVAQAAGLRDDPRFTAGMTAFYRRHTCRMRPWPPSMLKSAENQARSNVRQAQLGADEFTIRGKLRGWSRRADLSRITTPTWVTAGVDDQLGIECWEPLVREIPNAVATLYGKSSHVPHLEEEGRYVSALRTFLGKSDHDISN